MSVKVSTKFQVVIPAHIRNILNIKPGTSVEVIAKGKIAYLVPVTDLESLQKELDGGLESKKLRDKKDRKL